MDRKREGAATGGGKERRAARATLPFGSRVTLDPAAVPGGTPPLRRGPGAPLFSEVYRAVGEGAARLWTAANVPCEPSELPLGDFHALRALLTHAGVLAEDEVTIPCRNCDAPFPVSPCARLAAGPFLHGELTDPELDAPAPAGEPAAIPAVALADGTLARAVVFAPLTAGSAGPLHRALVRPRYTITSSLVRAMGIVSLGASTDALVIARALERGPDGAWFAVAAAFLRTHYPPRLFGLALCPACGARNDVDAPYEREFALEAAVDLAVDLAARSPDQTGEPFPDFDGFCAAAEAIQRETWTDDDDGRIAFVVDGETPACDDGGEPLLGAYLPPYAGDPSTPSRGAEIAIYYRTFRAIRDEEGPYPWRDELRETVEHEFDHHLAYLRGDDPVDDEERAEIGREVARVVGEGALRRQLVVGLGADVAAFARITWPLWLIVALLLGLVVFASGENPL